MPDGTKPSPERTLTGRSRGINIRANRQHVYHSWWRHQMETFSALLAIGAGNSPVPGEFPAQRPVTRSFDVFFDLRLNKRLCKQSRGWWFETPSCPLWCHTYLTSDAKMITEFSYMPVSLRAWRTSPVESSMVFTISAMWIKHCVETLPHYSLVVRGIPSWNNVECWCFFVSKSKSKSKKILFMFLCF